MSVRFFFSLVVYCFLNTSAYAVESLLVLMAPEAEHRGYFGRRMAMADFNKDGYADLAVGYENDSTSGNDLLVYYGPDYQRSPPQRLILDGGNNGQYQLATGKYDADTHDDLAVALWGKQEIHIYTGSSEGFANTPKYRLRWPADVPTPGLIGWDMHLAEVEGNGLTYPVLGNPHASLNDKTDMGMVFMFVGGPGNDTLKRVIYPKPQDQQAYLRYGESIAISDFDGDGAIDIAVGAPGWLPADEQDERNGSSPFILKGFGAYEILYGPAFTQRTGLIPRPNDNHWHRNNLFGVELAAVKRPGGATMLAVSSRVYDFLNGILGGGIHFIDTKNRVNTLTSAPPQGGGISRTSLSHEFNFFGAKQIFANFGCDAGDQLLATSPSETVFLNGQQYEKSGRAYIYELKRFQAIMRGGRSVLDSPQPQNRSNAHRNYAAIAVAGDVNGDGILEAVISDPEATLAGAVGAHQNIEGAGIVYQFTPCHEKGFQLPAGLEYPRPVSLTRNGDFDGDGIVNQLDFSEREPSDVFGNHRLPDRGNFGMVVNRRVDIERIRLSRGIEISTGSSGYDGGRLGAELHLCGQVLAPVVLDRRSALNFQCRDDQVFINGIAGRVEILLSDLAQHLSYVVLTPGDGIAMQAKPGGGLRIVSAATEEGVELESPISSYRGPRAIGEVINF